MSFCANLGFLFKEENNLINRYKLAKQAGFYSVETPFPYGYEKDEVVAAKNAANVNQVLINIYTGDVSKGELGFAAIPGKEEEFKKSMLLTIEYAKALGVKKIHIMAGKIIGAVTPAHDTIYEDNLQWAVQLLEKEDIMGLIEPINKYSVPQYYLNSYERDNTKVNDMFKRGYVGVVPGDQPPRGRRRIIELHQDRDRDLLGGRRDNCLFQLWNYIE